MVATLLVTKFFLPPARAALVERPDLINRLSNGLDRKLTLLSAPAGFGKTTLVSRWLESLPEIPSAGHSPLRAAWLSVDEDDNEPGRFMRYLIAALQQVEDLPVEFGQGALRTLQGSQAPSTAAVLTSLINDAAAAPGKIILVLDDLHLVEANQVHQALVFLLDNLPPTMHLVIATRQDPPLSLGRLRARDQINEVRAAELRFSTAEAADFLNQVMGLALSPSQVAELERRTEGWIAGLQLAALSMQGRNDVQGFIQSFSGTNRLVLDFLIEEVLSGLEPGIQEFLVRTSILRRLVGPLCDALTGRADSQELLEGLDQANLFIVPLDEDRCWYRYHHLFAELLSQRLASRQGDIIAELHGKASQWYEENGYLPEAVHHALAGEDLDTAIRLIETGALSALENSDFRFILDSVKQLPEAVLQNEPWLFIYHTWALLLTGHVEAANPNLEKMDRLADKIPEDDPNQKREMLGNIAGLRMISAGWNRDYEHLTEYANRVQEFLPEKNWIRAYCAMMMGGYYWGNGNLEAATDAFAESASGGRSSGNTMVAVSGACNHAHSLELAGHLQQAVELFQEAFGLAEQGGRVLPVANYIHKEIARVLYELNELDRANQHLLDAVELGQLMADRRAEKIGYGLLAKVQIALGDFTGASRSIQNADQAVPSYEVDFDLRGGEYPEVWLWLRTNKVQELIRWLQGNSITLEGVTHFKSKFTLAMQARVMIALFREYQDQTFIIKASELLDGLLDLAEGNGWGSKVIEVLALQAVAYQEAGNLELAHAKLDRAIQLAEPEGFIRSFVDEGPPMAQLLYEALKRGTAPEYVQRLLAAFPIADRDNQLGKQDQSGLVEPLSQREIEVLELLARGLTNQTIAEELVLSPHTVKTHTRNIYAKLAVGNRTEAVARARILGILVSE